MRASSKLGLLIACVAVGPTLKQFLVFKMLHGLALADFLFLNALVLTLLPLAPLGWGDFFVGRFALSRWDGARNHTAAFWISNLAIAGTALIAAAVLLNWSRFSAALIGIFALDLLFLAYLQNSLKIYRSLGQMQPFFGWLALKQSLELVALAVLLVTGRQVTPMQVFLLEAVLTLGILALMYRPVLSRRLFRARPDAVTEYTRLHSGLAVTFLLNSATAAVVQNVDRLLLVKFVDAELYRLYMFQLINTSVLLSLNAFVFHFTYPRLAGLHGRPHETRAYIRRFRRWGAAAMLVMVPIQVLGFVWFNEHVYHGPASRAGDVLWAVVTGWLYLLQIHETMLITAMQMRKVLACSVAAIVSYVGVVYFFGATGRMNSITSLYLPLLAARLVYFGMMEWTGRRYLQRQARSQADLTYSVAM